MRVFSTTISVDGNTSGWILANYLFIEVIILIVVRILAAVTMGGLKDFNPLGNFFSSVRVICNNWIVFYFAYWGLMHYKQMYNLG